MIQTTIVSVTIIEVLRVMHVCNHTFDESKQMPLVIHNFDAKRLRMKISGSPKLSSCVWCISVNDLSGKVIRPLKALIRTRHKRTRTQR